MPASTTGDDGSTGQEQEQQPARSVPFSAVGGQVVKLQFRLSGASLFSFWLSETACGESRGYMAAGGPGSVKGVDQKGSCTD